MAGCPPGGLLRTTPLYLRKALPQPARSARRTPRSWPPHPASARPGPAPKKRPCSACRGAGLAPDGRRATRAQGFAAAHTKAPTPLGACTANDQGPGIAVYLCFAQAQRQLAPGLHAVPHAQRCGCFFCFTRAARAATSNTLPTSLFMCMAATSAVWGPPRPPAPAGIHSPCRPAAPASRASPPAATQPPRSAPRGARSRWPQCGLPRPCGGFAAPNTAMLSPSVPQLVNTTSPGRAPGFRPRPRAPFLSPLHCARPALPTAKRGLQMLAQLRRRHARHGVRHGDGGRIVQIMRLRPQLTKRHIWLLSFLPRVQRKAHRKTARLRRAAHRGAAGRRGRSREKQSRAGRRGRGVTTRPPRLRPPHSAGRRLFQTGWRPACARPRTSRRESGQSPASKRRSQKAGAVITTRSFACPSQSALHAVWVCILRAGRGRNALAVARNSHWRLSP